MKQLPQESVKELLNARKNIPRRVMVTGLGVVSPIGNSIDSYWQQLSLGKSGIHQIRSFDATGLDCRIAAEVKDFAPGEHLPPQDLRRVGRAVPLAIAATAQAFATANLSCQGMNLAEQRSWGVVWGSGGGTVDFTEEQYRLYFAQKLRKVSAYNVSGSTPGNLSSELSLRFSLRGPSHVVSTGCTSSTDALGYAFNMIRFGQASHLVSGGADATITPGIMQGFCVMGAVTCSHNETPQGASRPFDADRDGFVLGEGAWALTLEERDAAVARGAPVFGEILGYGSTCDAYHRVRLDPSGDEPARAMAIAIEDAGAAKEDIGYIALHGTSTVLNDKTETLAVKQCFGKRAYDLPMSSIKSMIGHPQGASGAAGVVATLLAIRHSLLPPTVNFERPDPECDLNYIPNVALERQVDVALCNCIGFGSKNSALVIARGEPS